MVRAGSLCVFLSGGIEAAPAWDGTRLEDEFVEVTKKKRPLQLDDCAYICGGEVAKRQKAWLTREGAGTAAPWRPVDLQRTAARKVLMHEDSMIRHSTVFNGYAHFCFANEWEKINWSKWPGIGNSTDGGSDMITKCHALLYRFNCNCVVFHDQSHSAQRSFIEMLTKCGILSLWCLMLVTWNLEFGPKLEETRREELRTGLATIYETRLPRETPLFLQLAPAMVRELEFFKVVTFPRLQPIADELWQWLQKRNRTGSMGRRVANSRYGAAIHAARKQQGYWTVQLWERTCIAIEQDMLKGRRFMKKLVMPKEAVEGAMLGKTKNKVGMLQLEDRTLQQDCQNAIVCSVMTLQLPDHSRTISVVSAVAYELDAFHTDQNRDCRSAAECSEWLVRMVRGDYQRHLNRIVGLLSDKVALARAGV